jgi:hypothetical protein
MRSMRVLLITFCLTLALISGWLMLNPMSAFASTCCANCYDRPDQCCFSDPGTMCRATDGVGCEGSRDGVIFERLCAQ